MENGHGIILSSESFCQFLRADISYSQLVGSYHIESLEGIEFDHDKNTALTLDDLFHVLYIFAERPFSLAYFREQWFCPLFFDWGEQIGIPSLIGQSSIYLMDIDFENISDKMIILNDADMAYVMIGFFYHMDLIQDEVCEYYSQETADQDAWKLFEKLQDMAADYQNNRGLPLKEMHFPQELKKWFLSKYRNDTYMPYCREDEKKLFSIWLEDLAEQGDPDALEILADLCYGNIHPIYKCRWEKAKDCLLRLMEIASDDKKAKYSNMLGSIYYYGRCNGDISEYETALGYLILASTADCHEAAYLLGDMFTNGNAVPQSGAAAFSLYNKHYEENRKAFECGERDNSFADLSFRLGNCYRDGIGCKKNRTKAYIHYLQAKRAIQIRFQIENRYEDPKLASEIELAFTELRKKMGSKVEQVQYAFKLEEILTLMLDNTDLLQLSLDEKGTACQLKMKRVHKWGPKYVTAPKLLTIPELSYCELIQEIPLSINKDMICSWNTNSNSTNQIDHLELQDGEIHLYNKKKEIAVFKRGSTLFIKNLENRSGETRYRMAGVVFYQGDPIYEYLCDDHDIHMGSVVEVTTKYGRKAARVVRICEKTEEELELPLSKYKRI